RGRPVASFWSQYSEHGGALRKPSGGGTTDGLVGADGARRASADADGSATSAGSTPVVWFGVNRARARSTPTTPLTVPARAAGTDRSWSGARRTCPLTRYSAMSTS